MNIKLCIYITFGILSAFGGALMMFFSHKIHVNWVNQDSDNCLVTNTTVSPSPYESMYQLNVEYGSIISDQITVYCSSVVAHHENEIYLKALSILLYQNGTESNNCYLNTKTDSLVCAEPDKIDDKKEQKKLLWRFGILLIVFGGIELLFIGIGLILMIKEPNNQNINSMDDTNQLIYI
jgi:hypothetical protein